MQGVQKSGREEIKVAGNGEAQGKGVRQGRAGDTIVIASDAIDHCHG